MQRALSRSLNLKILRRTLATQRHQDALIPLNSRYKNYANRFDFNNYALMESVKINMSKCDKDDFDFGRDFNTVLTGLMRAGMYKEASNLIKLWEETSPLRLNVYLCTTFISVHAMNNDLQSCYRILEKSQGLFVPNSLTARSILTACITTEPFDSELVLKVYSLLRALGCEPATNTLLAAIQMWTKLISDKLEKGKGKNLKRLHLKEKAFSDEVFDTPEMQHTDNLLAFFEMVKFDLNPGHIISSGIVELMLREGRAGEALDVIEYASSMGVDISVPVFNKVIQCSSKIADLENAKRALNLMHSLKVAGNEFTFSNFLLCSSRTGYLQDGVEMLRILAKNGLKPSNYSYGGLFHKALRYNDEAVMRSLFDIMQEVSPGYISQHFLFIIVGTRGSRTCVGNLFKFAVPLALEYGVHMKKDLCENLSYNVYTVEEKDILMSIIKKSLALNHLTTKHLGDLHTNTLKRLIVNNLITESLATHFQFLKLGAVPNSRALVPLLEACAKYEHGPLKAEELIEDMEKYDIDTNKGARDFLITNISGISKCIKILSLSMQQNMTQHTNRDKSGVFLCLPVVEYLVNNTVDCSDAINLISFFVTNNNNAYIYKEHYALLGEKIVYFNNDEQLASFYKHLKNNNAYLDSNIIKAVIQASKSLNDQFTEMLIDDYCNVNMASPAHHGDVMGLCKRLNDTSRANKVVEALHSNENNRKLFGNVEIKSAIEKLVESNRIDSATSYLYQILKKSKSYNSTLVEPLLSYYGRSGQFDRAFTTIGNIERTGLVLLPSTVAAFIRACQKDERNLDYSLNLLFKYIPIWDNLDRNLYHSVAGSTFLNYCLESDNFSKAMYYADHLRRIRKPVTFEELCILTNMCARDIDRFNIILKYADGRFKYMLAKPTDAIIQNYPIKQVSVLFKNLALIYKNRNSADVVYLICRHLGKITNYRVMPKNESILDKEIVSFLLDSLLAQRKIQEAVNVLDDMMVFNDDLSLGLETLDKLLSDDLLNADWAGKAEFVEHILPSLTNRLYLLQEANKESLVQ